MLFAAEWAVTRLRHAVLAPLVVIFACCALPALALPPAQGKIVLTITGRVAYPNASAGAVFDMTMLEHLPQHSFTTLTPWDKKPIQFSGPLLRDVLAAAGATGSTIKALALNDYQSSMPFDDVSRFDVVLAHTMNGQKIPVKTKGPLFIVYPFDSKPELRASVYYERSAWQLKLLHIE